MDRGSAALSDFIFAAKYARHLPEENRRETFNEAVDRVIGMHEQFYGDKIGGFVAPLLGKAKVALQKKQVLGSQRNMQYGGAAVLRNHARAYNCCASYCDRPRFFAECLWLLLSGCGTGFSVQKHHVDKLPPFAPLTFRWEKFHVVQDSIEGWADALDELMKSFFEGYRVNFDFSKVRPEGSPLSSGVGVAPGPEPLRIALEAIAALCEPLRGRKLRPIEAYDIVMHASCAVLSGGVRRSATIALFSPDDEEMLNAKTGNWFEENPQRARSNNSAVMLRDATSFEDFARFVSTAFVSGGEPGFFWVDDLSQVANPCLEIGFSPVIDGESVWGFCNLSTINGCKIGSEEDFYEACRSAALLGTLQAGYTDFHYLTEGSRKLARSEALIGVSITGIQDAPQFLLDPKVLNHGAYVVSVTNRNVAAALGLSPAARATCIKPEGTTSALLGTASGKHRRHARRYIRRVQCNKNELPAQAFIAANPHAWEPSVWREGDLVLKFPILSPDDANLRADETALEQLQDVVTLKKNWVDYGKIRDFCNNPNTQNNVSCTVTVKADEVEDVIRFIYDNREHLAGVSILAASGDLDYPQAPFVSVDEPEREKELEEWCNLVSNLKDVDYSQSSGQTAYAEDSACAGGKCEV